MRRRDWGFALQVERRIFSFQQTVKVDTQDLRSKWIIELDDLFDMATSIAKGKVGQQHVGEKLQSITLKEQQMWAQVAANIGLAMGNLAKTYDETRFNEDLARLESQIAEIKKIQEYMSKEQGSAAPSLTNTDKTQN